MNEVYLKVKSDGKVYKVPAGNLELSPEDEVLFELDQNQDTGIIVGSDFVGDCFESDEEQKPSIIRRLNEKDKEKILELKSEATETLKACSEKIEKHGLSMELLDADLSYDGRKLTFYFTAPGRVDFRSLVPDLASTFKKLIRLQQVGSRDKAKCMDGVGKCGRKICCRDFLKGDLESVTMDMAYCQNLGQSGSNRVTGLCGKLQCCLKYELEYYKERREKMPQVGEEIKTEEGMGKVVSQNIVKNKVGVELVNDKRIVEVDC
jgi:cell fate regulator YaaT (PSP1 superfamily)